MRTTVLVLLLLGSVWAADEGAAGKRRNRTNQPAEKTESFTGCVDQRGEGYVLAGAGMKEEAKLSGKTLSDDNFARFVGHKVTVQGTADRTGTPAVIRVVRIDDVSPDCR